MVVKIQPASAMVRTILDYNERKVSEGKATLIHQQGFTDESHHNRVQTLERLQRLSYRSENVTFHASINPGPEDLMDDHKIKEFCNELMGRLGYGNQPYVLYRHNDIEREHYHIVSSRVLPNGRLIDAKWERQRCYEIMKELAPKYGYTIGASTQRDINPTDGFSKKKGNTIDQIEAIFEHALHYNFRTEDQFICVMRALGVEVELTSYIGGSQYTFYGLENGRKCTAPVEDAELSIEGRPAVLRAAGANANKPTDKSETRVINIFNSLAMHSVSEDHLKNMLKKTGITFIPMHSPDGSFVTVTFVDSRSKCALSCSDFGVRLPVSRLEEMRRNQWKEENIQKEDDSKQLDALIGALLSGEGNRKHDDEDFDRRYKQREEQITRIKR